MMFEKRSPKKGRKKKKHVWPEVTSPTAGIRADTWEFADPVITAYYDNEKR